MTEPGTTIDVETSHVKMTPVRLLLLIAAIVGVTNFGSNILSAAATKADVSDGITAHSERSHDATVTRIAAIEQRDARQDAQLEKLDPVPERVAAINAKMDIVLTQQVEEARNSPRKAATMKRAARKVRTAARKRGETDDPLAGVEGL